MGRARGSCRKLGRTSAGLAKRRGGGGGQSRGQRGTVAEKSNVALVRQCL